MRKRLFGMVMVLCMVVSLLPVGVGALEEGGIPSEILMEEEGNGQGEVVETPVVQAPLETVAPVEVMPLSGEAYKIQVSGLDHFKSVVQGYEESLVKTQTVTIENVGTEPTGELTIFMEDDWNGENKDFIISNKKITSILPGGTDTFTIRPNPGCPTGKYGGNLNVTGENGLAGGRYIEFVVTKGPVFTGKITVGGAETNCMYMVLTEPVGETPGTVQIGNDFNNAIDWSTSGQLEIKTSVTNEGKTYNVVAIGDNGFFYCSQLSGTLELPDQITKVGKSAFINCFRLTDVKITSKVTYGSGVFQHCGGISNIVIEDGVTNIPNYMFGNCKQLETITVGKDVTSIGRGAFQQCPALTTVTLNAITAPKLDTTVFDFLSATYKIKIPAGSTLV